MCLIPLIHYQIVKLCKIPTHIGFKGNEEVYKSNKTSDKFAKNDEKKITLFRIVPDHQENQTIQMAKGAGKQY